MNNIVVSIGKNKSIENQQLFEDNYSFLEKVVNYEMNKLNEIEKVYDKKVSDREISSLINIEKRHPIWPLLSSILAVSMFTAMFLLQNMYWLIPTIVFASLSSFGFVRYFDENNSKMNVILRVYQNIEKEDYLSMNEMKTLQKLITKEEMLDLIRMYDDKISFKNAISALRHHFIPFKDYKAMQQYLHIENQNVQEFSYGNRYLD